VQTVISSVTDFVMEGITVWQVRPLDAPYPVVCRTGCCDVGCNGSLPTESHATMSDQPMAALAEQC